MHTQLWNANIHYHSLVIEAVPQGARRQTSLTQTVFFDLGEAVLVKSAVVKL